MKTIFEIPTNVQPTPTREGRCVEASDLQLTVWPAAVRLDGVVLVRDRRLTSGRGEDEELGGYVYKDTRTGFELTVFND